MCRWLAYTGPSIYLERLILSPRNSLVSQSLRALESKTGTNGDGFGIAWYGERERPGLYRDVLPAWNDPNLRDVCEQIRSPLFFGHVRASTGTHTIRSNCHPFRHGRWIFMHNGVIGGWSQLRRGLMYQVDPAYFPAIEGTTDSEVFFYLLLSNGLEKDPEGAWQRSVAQVLDAMAEHRITEPFYMTATASDGKAVYALRYASDDKPPSLYYACGTAAALATGIPEVERDTSVLILSEPLDQERQHWTPVPPDHVMVAGDGGISLSPFEPAI